MTNANRQNLIISIAAVIIILVLGWLIVARERASSTVLGKTDVVATSSEMTAGTIIIQDQTAGMGVKVASMELSKASWIAVKEDSSGRILGAGWFPAGASSGEVPLLRATVKGGKYEGLIYVDDGDKKFDLHKDTLQTGISAVFSAQ